MQRNFSNEREIQNFVLDILRNNNKYKQIIIEKESDLFNLMIKELERINNLVFSDSHIMELKRKILNKNNTETSFEFAQYLLGIDTIPLKIDSNKYIRPKFIDWENWENNNFYVSEEVSTIGEKDRRIDLLISINGIPLIAIELKKQDVKTEKAIDQLSDYKNDIFGTGMYRFVQILVGSNFDEVKLWANNKDQSKIFAFNWFNYNSRDLEEFVKDFLSKENLRRYIKETGFVFEFEKKQTILLRPYQEQAVNAIINFVDEKISSDSLDILNAENNGYVWHTTGSGKTLTSFKAAKLLSERKDVDKVFFLLDRKDLSDQTSFSFKNMYKDSNSLNDVSMFNPRTSFELEKLITKEKFIVTTIQKMNKMLSRDDKEKVGQIKNKNVIFIIDECHRSISGTMAQRVRNYFKKAIMIGFSGTPIFESKEQSYGTIDYFGRRLHTYNILDAINDRNVLGFSVRQYLEPNGQFNIKYPKYIEAVKKVVKDKHATFTQNGAFNAIFAFDKIETMLLYYESFLELENELFITPIFSNTLDNADFNSDLEKDDEEEEKGESNSILENYQVEILKRYNRKFDTNFSLDQDGFNRYILDARAKFKKGEIDIMFVVNMLLTGYDSPKTNTLYVLKKMYKHNLIQAFSRTNRIYNKSKENGLIINFALEEHVINDAIATYSNKNIDEIRKTFIGKTYEELQQDLAKYANAVMKFHGNPDNNDAIVLDNLTDEELAKYEDTLSEFLKATSKLNATITDLKTFEEYDQSEDKIINDIVLQDCLDKSKKIKELFDKVEDKSIFKGDLSEDSFEFLLTEKKEIKIDYNYILSILNSTKMQEILVSEKVSSKEEMLSKILEWRETILVELEQEKNDNKINMKEYKENKFMVETQFDFFADNITKRSKESYSKEEFTRLKKDAMIYMLEMKEQQCVNDMIEKFQLQNEIFFKNTLRRDFNLRIKHEQIDQLSNSRIANDFFEITLSDEMKLNFIETYQEELNSYALMAELINKLEEVY